MWYVYILQSIEKKTFYKGITDNLDRRLQQHLQGQSATTRNMLPVKLVHVELCETRVHARKLEKFFKSGYGREILKELGNS